jgi:hypothetical protein
MKKILTVIGLLALLTSCQYDRGDIPHPPTDFIEIHGKVYKIMSIVPCDGCSSMWIMYPKDSLDSQPQVIKYDVKQGKQTINQTVIKVD